MVTKIHPTAIIHAGAELGQGVEIGPYSIVGPKVKLGDRVKIHSHGIVEGRTTIGADTQIYPFATVGITPQDLKYRGEDTELIIGEQNSIREYVNISKGTVDGGGKTVIGNKNLFMVYVHIAHDCIIANNCIFANSASIAGHVEIADQAVVGGLVGVHQFCKIGTLAMLGAGSMVAQDVLPYCMVHGDRATINGLNIIGLRRMGLNSKQLDTIKEMYRLVFRAELTQDDAVAKIKAEIPDSEFKTQIVSFLGASKRGLCR